MGFLLRWQQIRQQDRRKHFQKRLRSLNPNENFTHNWPTEAYLDEQLAVKDSKSGITGLHLLKHTDQYVRNHNKQLYAYRAVKFLFSSMDLVFLHDKQLLLLHQKHWGHISMNLALAAFPHLLVLVPVPVPSQWLCQHKHVCSHMVHQREEVPGLKITRSFELRAAPLADDTP